MKTSRLLKNITLGFVLSLILVWTPCKANAIIGDSSQPVCGYLSQALVELLKAKVAIKIPLVPDRMVARKALAKAGLHIAKAKVAGILYGVADFVPDLEDSAISMVGELTNDAFGTLTMQALLTCAGLAIVHAEIETMGLTELDALDNILAAQVIVDSVWGALTCNLI